MLLKGGTTVTFTVDLSQVQYNDDGSVTVGDKNSKVCFGGDGLTEFLIKIGETNNMRKTIFTCDHCGKEIDEMRDYPDTEFDDFFDIVRADLCNKCFNELNNIVLKYLNKEKDGKREY